MPLSVSQVDEDQLGYVWKSIEPMIAKALSHGQGDCTNKQELLRNIVSGEFLMWVIHDGDEVIAALVLSFKQYVEKLTLYVELAAGRDLELWINEVEILLRDYARLAGADTIEASCRRGLARKLGRRSWKAKAVIMELI